MDDCADSLKAWQQKFLGRFVDFRQVIRLYIEGKGNRPRPSQEADPLQEKRRNHATLSGC
jgi:hypothetical protein